MLSRRSFLTEALTQEAVRRLSALRQDATLRERPFFLYMSHYAVHAPFDERGRDARFIGNYPEGSHRSHPKDGRPWSANERRYAALIEGTDKSLGDIMDWLEASGVADNTVILFMADNGGACHQRAHGRRALPPPPPHSEHDEGRNARATQAETGADADPPTGWKRPPAGVKGPLWQPFPAEGPTNLEQSRFNDCFGWTFALILVEYCPMTRHCAGPDRITT